MFEAGNFTRKIVLTYVMIAIVMGAIFVAVFPVDGLIGISAILILLYILRQKITRIDFYENRITIHRSFKTKIDVPYSQIEDFDFDLRREAIFRVGNPLRLVLRFKEGVLPEGEREWEIPILFEDNKKLGLNLETFLATKIVTGETRTTD